MLFAIENLPYWIFLGTGFLLFGFVIISGGGDEDADLDADFDADLDADIDADIDADADVESQFNLNPDAEVEASEGFTPIQILGWFGVGKAPLMLLIALDLCLWGLLGWMLNVAIASLIGSIPRGLVGTGVGLMSLLVGLIIGGQIARPIGKVFASFGEDASGDRLIGCMGRVSSAKIHNASEGKIAQVDVLDSAKNLVTVNAALPLWATEIPNRGDTVLVIERADDMALYYVIAKDGADQERWFSSRTPTRTRR